MKKIYGLRHKFLYTSTRLKNIFKFSSQTTARTCIKDKHTPNNQPKEKTIKIVGKVTKLKSCKNRLKSCKKSWTSISSRERNRMLKTSKGTFVNKNPNDSIFVLNKRTKKAHTFPTGGIAIPLQGIK